MADVYVEFKDAQALQDYMTATPGLLLRTFEIAPPVRGRVMNDPRPRIGAEIWLPPANAVVESKVRGALYCEACNQIGTVAAPWWVAAGDDLALFDANVAALTTRVRVGDLCGDGLDPTVRGRDLFFGGGAGVVGSFRSAIINVHGTCINGTAEEFEAHGITPAGGYVLLGTTLAKAAIGDTTVSLTTADDVSNYVGIRLCTDNVAGACDVFFDITLIAD
jgi:hypothetical protein